jgi:hypothetical protein
MTKTPKNQNYLNSFNDIRDAKAKELYGPYGDEVPNTNCFRKGWDSCRDELTKLINPSKLPDYLHEAVRQRNITLESENKKLREVLELGIKASKMCTVLDDKDAMVLEAFGIKAEEALEKK